MNGREVSVTEQHSSVLELVAQIEQEHVDEGWIIVEVKVGGESYNDFTLPDGSLIPYDPDLDVEVTSRKSSEIAIDILSRFDAYMGRLGPGIDEIVSLYRKGEVEDANRLYTHAIQGVTTMMELVQSVRNILQLDSSAVSVEGRDLDKMISELKETVTELVSAQTENDYERLADALEFEMTDQLGRWRKLLAELKQLSENLAAES